MLRWSRAVPAIVLVAATAAASPASATDHPTLTVTVVESGLVHPWDVAFVPSGAGLPSGTMLYTQ